jgi:hypothetical protein
MTYTGITGHRDIECVPRGTFSQSASHPHCSTHVHCVSCLKAVNKFLFSKLPEILLRSALVFLLNPAALAKSDAAAGEYVPSSFRHHPEKSNSEPTAIKSDAQR